MQLGNGLHFGGNLFGFSDRALIVVGYGKHWQFAIPCWHQNVFGNCMT